MFRTINGPFRTFINLGERRRREARDFRSRRSRPYFRGRLLDGSADAQPARTSPDPTADWHRIFETLPDEHDYVVDEVEGSVPRELTGTLYRNGPSRNEIGGKPYAHLFDGDGMLSQFAIADGGIRYRNRYVRTNHYLAERAADKPVMRGYGQQRPGGVPGNAFRTPANVANTSGSVPLGQPAGAVRRRPAMAARSGHPRDGRRVRLRRRAEERLHVLRASDVGPRDRRAVQLRHPVRAEDRSCARTGWTARAGSITCGRSHCRSRR